MEKSMNGILDYLKKKYAPLAVIVYGSWRDGTNGQHSDFDALVVARSAEGHDTSLVDGVPLDVFIYPPEALGADADLDAMVPIEDGAVVTDTDGIGAELQRRVRQYIASLPQKTAEEIRSDVAWCRKMCLRAGRGDAEGWYRLHWLLTDSLSVFCDVTGRRYLGPKKSLAWMEREHPEAFDLYRRALTQQDREALDAWVGYLERMLDLHLSAAVL